MMQIAFYYGSSPDPARAALYERIRAATGGPFVHSCILFDDGVTGEATDVLDAGVQFTRRKYPATKWVMFDASAYNEPKAREWFGQHEGQPYDWNGANRCIDPTLKQEPGAWYCSEAVMTALGIPGARTSDSNSLARLLGVIA